MFFDVAHLDLNEIIKGPAYKATIQELNPDFKFNEITPNSFVLHLFTNSYKVDKDSDGKIIWGKSIYLFQMAKVVRHYWKYLSDEIEQMLIKNMVKVAIDYEYPTENRPENYNPDGFERTILRKYYEEETYTTAKRAARSIRKWLAKQQESDKNVESIYAGKYINWLGRETSEYLYSTVGRHGSYKAFNMYTDNPYKFKKLYNSNKNWVIAAALEQNINLPDDISDAIYEIQNHYANNSPRKIQAFSSLSPRTIRDVNGGILHRIVELCADNDIKLPTHTIIKKLCQRRRYRFLINTENLKYLSDSSHQALKTRKMTQLNLWQDFLEEKGIREFSNNNWERIKV